MGVMNWSQVVWYFWSIVFCQDNSDWKLGQVDRFINLDIILQLVEKLLKFENFVLG